jgi:uncharacterized Zn-binding protein involved in type VI secretion
VPLDSHGCPACPHPVAGPAIQGSPDVNVNRRPALRVDDPGIHAACCGANTWTAAKGSATVFINGKSAHRIGDQTRHCGGMGQLVEGSPNVIVGESSSGGGTAAAGSAGTSRGSERSQQTEGASGSTSEARSNSNGLPQSAPVASQLEAPVRASAATTLDQHWTETRIVDPQGNPIPGITLRLQKPDGSLLAAASTDDDGIARWDGLPAGDYSVALNDNTGALEPSS